VDTVAKVREEKEALARRRANERRAIAYLISLLDD